MLAAPALREERKRPVAHRIGAPALAVLVSALAVLGPPASRPARAAGGLDDFHVLWTRDAGAGRAALDPDAAREAGRPSIRIDHTGPRDWSLTSRERAAVEPGDLFTLEAWVKVEGEGSATLCVVPYDAGGEVLEWVYAGRTARQTGGWRRLRARFAVPHGAAAIVPRLIGDGPATVWLDAFALRKEGNVSTLRKREVPAELAVTSAALRVAFRTADATLAVTDRRTGRTWTQKARAPDAVVTDARADAGRIDATLLHAPSGMDVRMTIALDGDRPECTVTLAAEGDLAAPLALPAPFVTDAGTYLVVPMNEGISYPVDDESIEPMQLVAYGGHGISMPFWGATDGEAGHMAILETPDDARIRIDRVDGRLCVAPAWEAQKGRFGYPRRLRYVFLDRGGHVAMCKRYRAYARAAGLLKTLDQKRRENPNVDLLVGAVNVWCWDRGAPALAKEMQEAGIERILWSHRGSPEDLRALNAMPGVLTSRYDIYQDVMNPENFPLLPGVGPDWTTEAWPKDLLLGPGGEWARGWEVDTKDGRRVPCGVLCDARAVPYAERRIAEDLRTHPYRCRFIDTTTASPWRECWSTDHPMTRTDSRKAKMDLLALVPDRMHLVCGSETGHDAAVPYVHYFEGMLSLGPYRVPDSGRDMMRIWTEVPEPVAKFQMGHAYRLPLWELVYHDCVVAQWYWGDYNNKLPALWDKRDLFNALYGTPPMFMFNRARWQADRDRFVRSWRTTGPVARAVGYAEMTDHRFLAADRSVQQTAFAGGVTVTVNFGAAAYRLPDGAEVPPMGVHVAGVK